MKYGLYAVKDVKTTFWTPHTQVNDVAAQRAFANMVNSDDPFMAQNYTDVEYWKLGTFDDVTGITTSEVVLLCSGVDVKKVTQ